MKDLFWFHSAYDFLHIGEFEVGYNYFVIVFHFDFIDISQESVYWILNSSGELWDEKNQFLYINLQKRILQDSINFLIKRQSEILKTHM